MNIIRRILGLIVMLFYTGILFGQMLPIGYDTLRIEQEIIVDGGLDYYGSGIEKDIASKFIKGGLITEEMKDRSFSKHGAVNRFGGIGMASIEYRNYNSKLLKKKDWGYLIKGGYNTFFGLLYSKDLFGLGMYGNDRYRGETIDASGTNMSFMSFQKIGFGLIDVKSKSNISLNLYNISGRATGHLRTLEISQNLTGTSVEIKMDGEIETTLNNNFSQGIGVGVDLDFKIPVSWGDNKTSYIQFRAENIGFAYLYEKQKVYSFDTSFIFTGLEFNQIVGENSFFADSLSILDSIGIRSQDKNRTVLLPGYIQIGKVIDNHSVDKFQSFFGLRLYPTLIYSPFIYAGANYRLNDWLDLGANVSYGGFGKFKAGVYSSIKINKYSFGIATENIVGFFSKKASGQSLFIKLRWSI